MRSAVCASDGAACTMRSPMTVWWWTKSHSPSSSGPGLSTIGGLADVGQLGGQSDPLDLVLGQPQPDGRGLGTGGNVAAVPSQIGIALVQQREQHVGALAAGRDTSGDLVRVETVIDQRERVTAIALLRWGRRLRRRTSPPGSRAPSRTVPRRPGAQLIGIVRHRSQDAELVATHPVGSTRSVNRGAQPRAEPLQQRIARGVAGWSRPADDCPPRATRRSGVPEPNGRGRKPTRREATR